MSGFFSGREDSAGWKQERRSPQRGIAATKARGASKPIGCWFAKHRHPKGREAPCKSLSRGITRRLRGRCRGSTRVVFRGSLRRIAYVEGMKYYLRENGV